MPERPPRRLRPRPRRAHRDGNHQKALDQYHSALAIRERLATADRDNAD